MKEAILSSVEFLGNTAEDGGALYAASNTDIGLDQCTLHENTAASKGGGVYVSDSILALLGTHVKKNRAADGGGVYAFGQASLEYEDVSFESNKADNHGGGMAIESYDVPLQCTVQGSAFDKNKAVYGGKTARPRCSSKRPKSLP